LEQSLALFDANQLLGARILLRSAFETIAVLIYLNQLTRKVLSGALDFSDFSAKTATLFLGSRDQSTTYNSLNIVTILEKCDSRYSGMMDLYAKLSESAHPNYWGMAVGYSNIDKENYVVTYTNRWHEMYSQQHLQSAELCISVFLEEYNREWPDAFEELETWIEANDAKLKTVA
jgi:hypothetical protein